MPPSWTTPTAVTDPNNQYLEVSTVPNAGEAVNNLTFNTMNDLAMPVRRFWMQRTAAAPQGAYISSPYPTMGQVNANFGSADLLMTDVLSFDVRVC